MTQKTSITNYLKYYKEFLPLLFYLQGQLFYLQFMESQLLWRIQQYTLKLKSYTFSSPYFLISFLPKPKEIPRNRNTKKKPKHPSTTQHRTIQNKTKSSIHPNPVCATSKVKNCIHFNNRIKIYKSPKNTKINGKMYSECAEPK